jgi:hypothetical protein
MVAVMDLSIQESLLAVMAVQVVAVVLPMVVLL